RILRHLYYPSMYSREDSVIDACEGTYAWILEETADRDDGNALANWLRKDSGVFHISGRPGTGKSTLMKLLLRHPRTMRELETWAGDGGSKLVFGHFFFWNSGDEPQRSWDGLYRSLLFETLRKCPDLIPTVFPRPYKAFSRSGFQDSMDGIYFRRDDYVDAFNRLVSTSPGPEYRLCFFIDGLDEIGAQDSFVYQTLADSLVTGSSSENVKILATSRPYFQFQDSIFSSQRLRLDELTSHDIRVFGLNTFKKRKRLTDEIQSAYPALVERVVDKAEGVFLWAHLVVNSLIRLVCSTNRWRHSRDGWTRVHKILPIYTPIYS
ncbi:hypothetical protein BGZ61DRAFT_372296, partial [Ilyonectria robusta]|uniref:uncharacterized protein n=1 Tax=Ilyonectria robusta TaxID=1079257 RepID=UPI001E8D6332